MAYAKSLIDAARALGNADAELARRIGVSRSYLCDVAAGRKALSPESAALLAALCGDDATEAAKRVMVENAREPRRSMLERALFACWAAGGAALTIANAARALTVYTLSTVPSIARLRVGTAWRQRRPGMQLISAVRVTRQAGER